MSDVKRVVLAYSGGLDTSVIAKWLEVERGLEVVTFTADLGQGEEIEPAREKAKAMGIPDRPVPMRSPSGRPARATIRCASNCPPMPSTLTSR